MRRRIWFVGLVTLTTAISAHTPMAFAAAHEEEEGERARADRPTCDPCFERAARYRALGLPESSLEEFLESERSLTDWYNREHLGGPGLRKAGWILTGIGLASLALGGTLLALTAASDEVGAMVLFVVSIPCLALGGLETVIGIPLLIAGHLRTKRWAKEGELDRAPLHELERRRRRGGSRTVQGVSLTPYFSRGGGGLSFSFRF